MTGRTNNTLQLNVNAEKSLIKKSLVFFMNKRDVLIIIKRIIKRRIIIHVFYDLWVVCHKQTQFCRIERASFTQPTADCPPKKNKKIKRRGPSKTESNIPPNKQTNNQTKFRQFLKFCLFYFYFY